MRLNIYLIFMFTIVGCSATGSQIQSNSAEIHYPKSINEVVEILVDRMSEGDKASVLSKKRSELVMYHHGWGTRIRNEFSIWKNEDLLKDCGGNQIHPDDCSMIIIRAVWEQLRLGVPQKDIEKIDRINDLLDKIKVPPYRKKDGGIIDFVSHLNEQVEASQYSTEFTIEAECTSDHYRLKNFYNESEQSLSGAIGYIKSQFLASVTVEPNRIILTPLPFKGSKKCITNFSS